MFLAWTCIFFIGLTHQPGQLDLTDKDGTIKVKHDFVYESEYYEWDIQTVPYWLNSISTLNVYFYKNEICLHWVERPGTHPGDWTLTVIHRQSGTVYKRELSETGYWWFRLDDENNYRFIAEKYPPIGLYKLEIPNALIVNKRKR